MLLHLIPKKEEDWRPSMTLIDIIQQIPAFITEMIKNGGAMNTMIGKFHLGLQYDMNIWHSNPACGIYPCKEEKETAAT